MTEIEIALDEYKIDHGTYPIYTGVSIDGGSILAKALVHPLNPPEFPYLEIFPNRKVLATIGGVESLVDLWGDPIHYRCEPPGKPIEEKSTMNPTYDLWSTGGDPDNPPDKWITNWGN